MRTNKPVRLTGLQFRTLVEGMIEETRTGAALRRVGINENTIRRIIRAELREAMEQQAADPTQAHAMGGGLDSKKGGGLAMQDFDEGDLSAWEKQTTELFGMMGVDTSEVDSFVEKAMAKIKKEQRARRGRRI